MASAEQLPYCIAIVISFVLSFVYGSHVQIKLIQSLVHFEDDFDVAREAAVTCSMIQRLHHDVEADEHEFFFVSFHPVLG